MEAAGRKAVRLYCPSNLHPNRILSPEDRRLGDGIMYLCHAIMTRRVQDHRQQRSRDGFAGLKAQYLQNIIGRHNWAETKLLAISSGVVECDGSYSVGRRSTGYRVASPYAEARWELRDVTDTGLRRRLQKWRASRHRAEWRRIESGQTPVKPEVCEYLFAQLQRCRIREDAPVERFAPEVGVAVDRIRRGDWFFHVDRYGRIHTNITNLKRELRSSLRVERQGLADVDIASSQPLFIGVTLAWGRIGTTGSRGGAERGRESKVGKEGDTGQGPGLYDRQTDTFEVAIQTREVSADMRQYLELCEAGELYRFVERQLPGRLDYDSLKRRVLASLYDKDSHRNAVYEVLNDHFPTLMRRCRRLKAKDYRRLAHLAQRVESEFMYCRVVPRVMRERPGLFVTTIHDSILVPCGAEEYVRAVMLSEFRRLGISPTVRIQT
ncbi:MAG: hypothetical protein ACYTG0_11015 [Planctomycetota bacterium]|jgi:hypothetical protein